ncbi:beta,beta-carotene 15,15'-dioxygenase [Chanos chanos]|uniref:Beta,beta-carotene 15,15'-dioxygenase n=1 Tax=Chanos chanos TaxID=29144 RepID=A0A6J2UKR0_CHACN|nr:beta,beta-carotene 15,15'-dioxygenase-like [Chanos chanos]
MPDRYSEPPVKMQSIIGKNGTETADPVKADVSGSIPTWLNGTLLRNGPGLFSLGETTYNHWFDGMALIHSFTFKDGEVYYRSKFLKSHTYMKNSGANRIVVSEFGTMVFPDPCKNIFSKAFTYLSNAIPDFTDNNLVNIIRYGEDYYASSEVNYINQIDPMTLETVGRTNYRNHIALNLATAHPHYDDEGNTYNMGTAIMGFGRPKYVIFKVPADATDEQKKKPALRKVEQICSIPFRSTLYPSYFHSFGMTDNYIIFVEQAFKLDILRLATAYFRGVNWGGCLKYDKDDTTLIHLINRKTGKAISTKFYADPFVTFHHINAYEDNDHVVFDLITYKDSNLYDMFYLKNMTMETEEFIETNKIFSPPVCQRFVLPLNVNKDTPSAINLVKLQDTTATAVKQQNGSIYCTPDSLFQGLELPRINDKYNCKKYRYFYGSRVEWSPHPNKIAKVDIVTRKHLEWTEEECYPSEPVFIPSPDAVEEDDGIILSSVVSLTPNRPPFMLVLNAKTFEEIARASINATVHMDLHGLFVHQKTNIH